MGKVFPLPPAVRARWEAVAAAEEGDGAGGSGGSGLGGLGGDPDALPALSGRRRARSSGSSGGSPPASPPRRRPWESAFTSASVTAVAADGSPALASTAASDGNVAQPLRTRQGQAEEKRAALLEATRARARKGLSRVLLGRKSAQEADITVRTRVMERMQAAQAGAEGRRHNLKVATVERLRASHAMVLSKVCSNAAGRDKEAAHRRQEMAVRLSRARSRRQTLLGRRVGSGQASASCEIETQASTKASPRPEEVAKLVDAFRASRAALKLQRAWKAFTGTARLAREFKRAASAVLEAEEAPEPKSGGGGGQTPAWAFDPEDAARVKTFEVFAKQLHCKDLLRAASALLSRLETRVVEHKMGHTDLSPVWARVFPRSAKEGRPLCRYPQRVFLSAFMIRSFPEVVFNEVTGSREAALHSQALALVADFRALLEGTLLAGASPPLPGGAVRRALEGFDHSWVAFADQFSSWKIKDAAALESDLVTVACRMQESVFGKCGSVEPEKESHVLRSHDLHAISSQLATDLKLIQDRIIKLSGSAGALRLKAALSASKTEFERRMQENRAAGPAATTGEEHKNHHQQQQPPVLTQGQAVPGGVPTPALAKRREQLDEDARKDSILLETLYDPDYRLPDAVVLADLDFCLEFSQKEGLNEQGESGRGVFQGPISARRFPERVKRAMERAFWDSVIAGVRQEPQDFTRLVEVLEDLGEEVLALAPKDPSKRFGGRDPAAAVLRGREEIESMLRNGSSLSGGTSAGGTSQVLADYLERLARSLFFLGAPAREGPLQDGFGRLLAQARAPESGTHPSAFKLCMCARYLFVAVRLTKLDVANARLRSLVNFTDGGTAFEMAGDAFLRRYGVTPGSRASLLERASRTCAWLTVAQDAEADLRRGPLATTVQEVVSAPAAPTREGTRPPTAVAVPGMHTGRAPLAASVVRAPSVPEAWHLARLGSPFPAGSAEAVLATGLADLMQSSEELSSHRLPELLDLDASRLRESHSDFQRLIVLACCCIVLRSLCPQLVGDALEGHLARASTLLEDEDTCVEDLGALLAAAAASYREGDSPRGTGTPPPSTPAHGDAAAARLLRQLLDPDAGLQAVQRNVLASVQAHLLLGGGTPAAEAAAVRGLQRVQGLALAGRARALALRLRSIALVTGRCHAHALRLALNLGAGGGC